jgi:hypothetical protein
MTDSHDTETTATTATLLTAPPVAGDEAQT